MINVNGILMPQQVLRSTEKEGRGPSYSSWVAKRTKKTGLRGEEILYACESNLGEMSLFLGVTKQTAQNTTGK